MLRIARDVEWLRLGSCTDHVISAAATTPHSAITPSPASSRKRRAKASRIEAGNWPTSGMTRSIAGMLMGPSRLIQNFDQPVQCLGCCFTVLHQRQANVAGAGIAAVRLLPRQIAAGHHAHAAVPVEFHRRRFVAAAVRHIEPDAEAAGGSPITVAIAENLIGQNALAAGEPPVFLPPPLPPVIPHPHLPPP